MADEKLTFTISEVSKLLSLSRGATYQAARMGQLPTIRFGRRLLVPRIALERMLNEVGNDQTKKF